MTDENIIRVSIELERPITPGDLERAYCELREKTQEVTQR